MKSLRNRLILAVICLSFSAVQAASNPQRIISLNGAITEIVCALGHQDKLVGVDVTSTYPKDVKTKAKDLGHVRSVSVENIIALKPQLVLATQTDLSPELVNRLKQAKIDVVTFNHDFSVEGVKKLIEQVAGALAEGGYKKLFTKIDTDFAKVRNLKNKPKVLFIYARGAGTLMVAGKNTPMEKIIALAGGVNAVNDFEDFKPLTPESLLQADPDYILLFTSGLQSLGGVNGILDVNGISKTRAGKNKKIIAMDGQLLSGFGPRVGEAAQELNQLLSK
ncbi:MAG: ABC transporter substrate-binding protein [Flavobacteriaceae bacterium]